MKIFRIIIKHQTLIKILGSVFLLFFYVCLYKILSPRVDAFGCGDDCFNFAGGYFLLHGKKLFSEIFYNHAPFMAHISAFIQATTHPQNLSELVLRHRQFIFLFGLVSEILLLFRFGLVALPFALVYELTKFYVGGDRFLAEGIIVYPLTYLSGIVFFKFFKKRIFSFDYVIAAITCWFILFMREPYSIVTLFLFFSFLWTRKQTKIHLFSLGLFLILSLATLFSYNISEFFFNVVTLNKLIITSENVNSGILGVNMYKSFLYPFVIFFQGQWNFIRYIEIILSGIFIVLSGFFVLKKKWKWIVFLWLFLGFANFRLVAPGQEFYGTFHLIPWYGLTIFTTLLMLAESMHYDKRIFTTGSVAVVGIIVFVLFSKGSYVKDRIDTHTDFITNYGNELQVGNVVNSLSNPSDTLFLDGSEDAIYFVAKRYSPYKYSWYTSLMPQITKYTDERQKMFAYTPPDFYYGSCPNQKDPTLLLPDSVHNDYVRLYNLDKPSCLWVKKSKIPYITDKQWQKAGESLYFREPHS